MKGMPAAWARVPGAWLAMHKRAVALPRMIGRGSWGSSPP